MSKKPQILTLSEESIEYLHTQPNMSDYVESLILKDQIAKAQEPKEALREALKAKKELKAAERQEELKRSQAAWNTLSPEIREEIKKNHLIEWKSRLWPLLEAKGTLTIDDLKTDITARTKPMGA